MDLDERLLKRIASRLGLTKIQFKPYTKEQLVNIIKNRLGGLTAFDNAAIEFCASKVAPAHVSTLPVNV